MHEVAAAPGRAHRLRGPALVVLIGVFLVRYWFSSDRRVIHISPDEPSQLAIARFLAGENRWNMFDHATWQPLLGTLISPIYWFTTNGETVVRWALGVNAVIGGLGAVVLVFVARRLTGLTPWTCAVIATAVAVAPSSLSASAFIWAEPLVALSFTATVLVIMRFHDHDRLATAGAAIVLSIAGYTAHSRLLPLIATTLMLTVGAELWRRRWQRAGLLWVVAMAGIAISALWKRFLLDRVWDDPSNQNTVSAVLDRLGKPVEVAEAFAGQIWYQLAATLGLAALGTIVLVGRAIRAHRPTDERGHRADVDHDVDHDIEHDVDRVSDTQSDPIERSEQLDTAESARGNDHRAGMSVVDARILLVSWLPLIGLSAVFMSDRGRADQYIYGRYNDAVMWPVVVLGVAWIVDRARHGFERRHVVTVAATATTALVLGLVVDGLHGDEIREGYGVRGMIAGILAHVDGNDTLDVWRTTWFTTALFAVVVGVIVVARRVGRAGAPVLAIGVALSVALVAVGAVRTRDIVDAKLNGWARAGDVRDIDALVPPGARLGVRPVPESREPGIRWVPQRQRYMLYQLYLPHRSFVRDRGVDDDVGPYVFAPVEDPDLLAVDARLLWSDPTIQIGLWKEPPTP